ncbi:MAG: tripartite tricarboxylate transporter substrate binding protein [Burkholderiales bacterium]
MNRQVFILMTAATLALAPVIAQAQATATYPVKPIKLIVPTTPGSPPDLVARVIGEKLAPALGQPVLVENRPGTGGIIGLEAVAKSAPDGYTLGVISMPYVVTPSLVAHMPYDIERDLAPVSLVVWAYAILAVPAASPATSVADLVALAKAKPGALKFSSGGNGTPPHLAGELFKRSAGVDIAHIPYKGAPAGVTALLAGDVDMMIGATGALSAHLRSGRLRALATAAPRRIAAYPDLPTLIELGYSGVEIRDWQGVVAPAGMPKDLITRLHAEIAKAAAMPDVKQRFERFGMEAAGVGPKEFGAHIHSELKRWARVVREAGIKAD